MKKLTLATLSTLAFTLACTNVFAVDGTITVNGAVTDQTCTLKAGRPFTTGLKDLTVSMFPIPKSWFTTNPTSTGYAMLLFLTNADGTANCDVATTQAFKGIHLSAISPDHLDTADKTLLVNQASGASAKNPVFIAMYANNGKTVNFSEPWGTQAKSLIYNFNGETYLVYGVAYVSKTGIVDAQNVNAKINYTMHYN
ncbi:fimbrial protein [Acinetobacter guillouiae]|uniref:fimbrial protein n=1 Tax=Acinetobacter guillouiae TaxID=106649 RepID=UPI001AE8470C|nr:type 1 fimbrial protein [Acinetobacter guillouiae]MBP2544966.1 type 1 fimbria pilin [Acinetobacter guillouiae]